VSTTYTVLIIEETDPGEAWRSVGVTTGQGAEAAARQAVARSLACGYGIPPALVRVYEGERKLDSAPVWRGRIEVNGVRGVSS
jgi:hypothetical protein